MLGQDTDDIHEVFGDVGPFGPWRFRDLSSRYMRRSKFFQYVTPSTLLHGRESLVIDWAKFRNEFELLVIAVKDARIASERRAVIVSRQQVVESVFETHSVGTSEDLQKILPSVLELFSSEPFFSMIQLPSDAEFKLRDVAKEMGPFLKRWPPNTLDQLARCNPPYEDLLRRSTLLGSCSIESAVSVFSCLGCVQNNGPLSRGWCLIGWTASRAHLPCDRGQYNRYPFQLSESGCFAVVSLLELLGLDPQDTLPSDLDKLSTYFSCANCTNKNSQERLLSWRECVRLSSLKIVWCG
jgi:hypothetical protein